MIQQIEQFIEIGLSLPNTQPLNWVKILNSAHIVWSANDQS